MAKVLVVDDDRALLKALQIALRASGDEVLVASNGADALTLTARDAPDVILLDLGLPDTGGIEVCRQLRTWTEVPVIVLSASGSDDAKVAALDLGADDYVTKPFSTAELEARIRVALRHSRRPAIEAPELFVGELSIDLAHKTALSGGRVLDLTAKEFDLLAYLARHAGKVCTHQMILREVWGPGYGDEANYLRVYAHRLRRKLGEDGAAMLRTHPGIGYQLVEREDLAHGSRRGAGP